LRFEFKESGQLLIRMHNETPSVIPMCVCNPERSPVGINAQAFRDRVKAAVWLGVPAEILKLEDKPGPPR